MLVNLLGKPLKICGCSPRTGWYLDGYCKTDPSDLGNHSICSVVTDTFLKYTKSQGNNLIDPNLLMEFPGLKAGDHWCLCAERWEQARIDGVARAYQAKLYGKTELLNPLETQLLDTTAGKRRSAVIDLGDARDPNRIKSLVDAPISMSLRANSCFQIIDDRNQLQQKHVISQLEVLLTDNPKHLKIRPEWQCKPTPEEIERCLSHRDEAIQYGAALSLMNLNSEDCLKIINSMEERLWSDYVTHYYLTCIVGLRQFSEKSYLVKSALAETTPQYTKSRVAAAWACLKLDLYDQLDLLYQLSSSAYWKPLRWSCQQVFARMIDKQQSQIEL